ncbi:hypothetical protein AYO20_11397 [Fonsecaea nubica]|uniref:Uncharacterized protein n=1 Tax=Fonsecaea nubica TaxID=856822 RepID=A0A178BUH7_9EURO|nr:hypothetical protein AYO20_11397 [Fonsecaea nubica]OAL21279.1 hypothetical protein AYO20_11397 [Fonsecaea nubica]
MNGAPPKTAGRKRFRHPATAIEPGAATYHASDAAVTGWTTPPIGGAQPSAGEGANTEQRSFYAIKNTPYCACVFYASAIGVADRLVGLGSRGKCYRKAEMEAASVAGECDVGLPKTAIRHSLCYSRRFRLWHPLAGRSSPLRGAGARQPRSSPHQTPDQSATFTTATYEPEAMRPLPANRQHLRRQVVETMPRFALYSTRHGPVLKPTSRYALRARIGARQAQPYPQADSASMRPVAGVAETGGCLAPGRIGY